MCPWSVPVQRCLAVALIGMMAAIVLDRDAEKVLPALAWLTLAVAALTDRARSWRRLGITVGVWALVLGATGMAAWVAGDFPQAVHGFVRYQVGVIWLAVLWLALPLVGGARPWQKSTPMPGSDPRWVGLLMALLLAFAANATLSAGASMFPEESMKLLGNELLPYAGLTALAVRWATSSDAGVWWRKGLRGAWVVVVMTALGMGVIALTGLVVPALPQHLLEAGFYRVDADAPDTYRLQFLFHHHNRAGFFAACALFLALAGAWGRGWWRWMGVAACAAAAIALPLTLTRAALIAAGAGIVVFTALGASMSRRGRRIVAVGAVAAVPLMWFGLPDNYREHIAKIVDVSNYRQGEGGSIGARFVMWDNAIEMIERRPGLGFGYGFENFEAAAQADHPEIPDYFKHAVHAHNHWLETAAETGLGGLVLLLAFTVVRIGGLALAWWRGSRAGYPMAWLLLLWLSLEVLIQLYGLTNYTLRRNLGYLTYGIWAGSIILAVAAGRWKRQHVD